MIDGTSERQIQRMGKGQYFNRAEHFPEMIKDLNPHVQKEQSTLDRQVSKKATQKL